MHRVQIVSVSYGDEAL